MGAEGMCGEAELVDEQVRVVAGPVGELGLVASGGVQVVGQTVGDVVGVAQEPIEDVEEFSDVGELGGVDRCGGWVAGLFMTSPGYVLVSVGLMVVDSSVVPGGCPAQAVGGGVVITEPVGLAVEGQHHAAVQQPIQQGGRDGGVAQDFSPRPYRPIGRQND